MVDLNVSISPEETAKFLHESIINNSISGDMVDEYIVDIGDGRKVITQIYDKYFIRVENRVSLTVIIDNASGKTHIHASGSGGGRSVLLPGDGGASAKFEDCIYDAIHEYLIT